MADSDRLAMFIDGEWEAKDFAGFFQAVTTVFDLEALLWVIRRHPEFSRPDSDTYVRRRRFGDPLYYEELFDGRTRDSLGAYLDVLGTLNITGEKLFVVKIAYASPGVNIFAGSGEIIKEMRETFLTVVDADHRKKMNRATARRAHAEADSAEVDVELKRIQLWREKAELLRLMGLSDDQISKALSDALRSANLISDFRSSGKITDISDGTDGTS